MGRPKKDNSTITEESSVVVAYDEIKLPNTLIIEVVGTGNSEYIKKDVAKKVHRNVAEKLIKNGSVILKA